MDECRLPDIPGHNNPGNRLRNDGGRKSPFVNDIFSDLREKRAFCMIKDCLVFCIAVHTTIMLGHIMVISLL